MVWLSVGICFLFLSGCTTYSHQAKNHLDFERDKQECLAIARKYEYRPGADCPTCEAMKRCLEEDKGWRRVGYSLPTPFR